MWSWCDNYPISPWPCSRVSSFYMWTNQHECFLVNYELVHITPKISIVNWHSQQWCLVLLFQQFRVFSFPFSNFQSPDELFRCIQLTVFMIWEERAGARQKGKRGFRVYRAPHCRSCKQGRKVREGFRVYRALHCRFCKQGRKVREEFRVYRAPHCWFCSENRFIWVSPSLKSMHQMLSYLHYFTNKRQPVFLVSSYCLFTETIMQETFTCLLRQHIYIVHYCLFKQI